MTWEEKQLLIIDLCARLPYGVIVKQGSYEGKLWSFDDYTISFNNSCAIPIPYLRPMSSMTEEEDKEWQLYKSRIAESCDELLEKRIAELHDWFNLHHFDYRGLIPMGLALEAPEGMYKTE